MSKAHPEPTGFRSLLIVRSDDDVTLNQCLEAGADAVIVDLAGVVAQRPMARADAARLISAAAGSNTRVFVRLNGFGGGLMRDDLAALAGTPPAGFVLPQCGSATDLDRFDARLNVFEAEAGLEESRTKTIAELAATPSGALVLAGFTRPNRRLAAFAWDAGSLARNLGAADARDGSGELIDPCRLVRSQTLMAAAACGVPAIDTTFSSTGNDDGFRAECRSARDMGYTGKFSVHPRQVAIINKVFSPTQQLADVNKEPHSTG